MMAVDQPSGHLIHTLPATRGELKADEKIAKYTWFKVGGPAEVLFKPADEADLCGFLSQLPITVPVTVIGNASNLLIRDGGIAGVVIRLGRGFSAITAIGQGLQVGAAAADLTVARKARDMAISGLEFLAGIPGTMGGAVRMNAGAYGAELGDICRSIRAVDRTGTVHEVAARDLAFTYRQSDINQNWIVTEAWLEGQGGDHLEISQRMEAIQAEREITQPIRTLTGGSSFANPPGEKAWQLIDRAGCRGLIRGGAAISNLHCNFLINTGNATASDLEGLGEEVRRRVFEKTGVMLEWEIHSLGRPLPGDIKEIDQ